MYMFNVKENKGKLYGRMNDTEYAGLDMTIIEKGYNEIIKNGCAITAQPFFYVCLF